jgi:ribosomal protein S6--L-glutamate ligase
MIVSFHPLFRADRNILCAGREPDSSDLSAIRSASAVILPQGCPQHLYFMARNNCTNIFPNYDARFRYPGKIGQIKLFRDKSIPHPSTEIFSSLADYKRRYAEPNAPGLPIVFKFDWGGEGDTVYLIRSYAELESCIDQAAKCEASGQSGFLIQEYVPSVNRSLRVAVIGDHIESYWRTCGDDNSFHASISKGAGIDRMTDPDLIARGREIVAELCRLSAINLAGMDVIFAADESAPRPLLLEINYFFGRVGLGGSQEYYRILIKEIKRWLRSCNLTGAGRN